MSGIRSGKPFEQTALFVNDVFDKFGADFVKSWLSDRTCLFGERTIFTTQLGAERLSQRCDGLMTKHGVTAVFDRGVSEAFHHIQREKDEMKQSDNDKGGRRMRSGS